MTPAPNWNIKQHLLYLIVDPEFGHWEANKAPSCSLLIPTLCLSLVCWVCCSRSWSWCLLTSLHQLLGQWFYQDSVKFRFLGGHNGLEGITRAKRLQGGFMCTPEHSVDVQVLRVRLCPWESRCSTELRQNLSDELLKYCCHIYCLLGRSF